MCDALFLSLFLLACSGLLVLFKKNHESRIISKLLRPITFTFWWMRISLFLSPGGIAVIHDDFTPIRRSWGFTKCFDVSHMLRLLQSSNLNLVEQILEILEWSVRQCSLPPSSKHRLRQKPLEEWRLSL